jgi:mono/diheme cytochrome c family protein
MTFPLLQSRDVSSAGLRIEPNGVVDKSGIWVKLLALVLCISYQANVPAGDITARAIAGSEVFLKYCAGCHGFDGFAEYELAPSFSMGDRLHKSDEELLRSILAGKHAMPYWQNKLSIDMFRSAIAYLRVMQQRYNSGLSPREEPIPEMHFKFNPVGEDEDYWQNRD